MKRKAVSLFIITTILLGLWSFTLVPIAWAATCTWDGDTDTSWATAANWSCNAIPGASDTAIVPDVTSLPFGGPVVTDTRTVGVLTIQSGGVLTYTAGAGPTFTVTTFNIESGGKYIHDRAAATPLNTATNRTFDSNSLVEIRQFASPTTLPTFGNLTINNTGTVQMSGQLLNVSGNLVKQSTGEFRLATTQNVTLTITGHLDIQGGTLSFQSSATTNSVLITVTGNITVATGATLQSGSGTGLHLISAHGNWTNSGTFSSNANSGTGIIFNGAPDQMIGGSSVTAFNNVIVTNNSRVVIPNTNIPTVSGALTVTAGSALKQTQVLNNSSFNFLQISTSKFRGVDITTTANLGDTSVVITTTTSGGCTTTGDSSPAYSKRCYVITPATDGAATVKFWALTSELNGVALGNLLPYRYHNGVWTQLTNVLTGTADAGVYSFSQADTPGFSNFLLGDSGASPTAITLNQFTADSSSSPIGWWLAAASLIGLTGVLIGRRKIITK